MEFLVLLTLAAKCLAVVSGQTVESQAEAYWKTNLCKIPMPKAVTDSLRGLTKEPKATDGEGSNIDLQAGLETTNIDPYDYETIFLTWFHATSSKSPEASSISPDISSLDIFFFTNHLTQPERKLKLHFSTGSKSKFLPLQVAKKIPFSHDKVPEILNLLSVKPNSTQAKIIQETIKQCEESPSEGENNKRCVSSLEDLVDYVISSIGSQVKVLSTTTRTGITMEYTIEKAQQVSSDGNLVCHKTNYPYAVHHCHNKRNTDVYSVSLIDANGYKSKATAMCHKDTSSFDPEHLAFKTLKVTPGSVPICHFLGAASLIWTPNSNVKSLATKAQRL